MLRRFSRFKINFSGNNHYLIPKIVFPNTNIKVFVEKTFHEQTEMINAEKNLKEIIENLQKIYLFDEKVTLRRKKLERILMRTSVNAKTPFKDILEYYQSKNRFGFDQEILTMTLDYLGKTYLSIGHGLASEDHSVFF